jgi:hypothetical protein
MQLRTSARLLSSVGALTLAATLTSCGFDYGTDRVSTPTAGVNDRDAKVDVLNAVVVADHEGEGAFVASFANNEPHEAVSVDSIAGAGDTTLTADDFTSIEVPAGGLVNLATEGPVTVEGDFAPGKVVAVTIGLSNGENVELSVPVVPPCNEFEGLAPTPSTGSSSDTFECDVEAPATEEH